MWSFHLSWSSSVTPSTQQTAQGEAQCSLEQASSH